MKPATLRSPAMGAAPATLRSPRPRAPLPPVAALPTERVKQTAVAVAAAAALLAGTGPALALCPDLLPSPTGLKYCDVAVGSGEAPVKGAFIKVHYNGRLDSDIASGTFDSSYDRGRPLGFAVGTGQVRKERESGSMPFIVYFSFFFDASNS